LAHAPEVRDADEKALLLFRQKRKKVLSKQGAPSQPQPHPLERRKRRKTHNRRVRAGKLKAKVG